MNILIFWQISYLHVSPPRCIKPTFTEDTLLHTLHVQWLLYYTVWALSKVPLMSQVICDTPGIFVAQGSRVYTNNELSSSPVHDGLAQRHCFAGSVR